MTTEFIRDRWGHVIKTIATTEVEWDQDEQALMLALEEYRLLYCDGCGGSLEETMNPENEFAYTAKGPWLCWGCQAVGRARDRFVETHPNATRPDRWMLEKR